MKLALIGWPIQHSLSPSLYKEILGNKLIGYDLLECKLSSEIPSLAELASIYDGVSITAPYKKHFIKDVHLSKSIPVDIDSINTLAFSGKQVFATNTDAVAVQNILLQFKAQHGALRVLLLGSGSMAKMTKQICESLSIPVEVFSRKELGDISSINLSEFRECNSQNIIVNACSRDFVFRGKLTEDDIFWDYNYSFSPHAEYLPRVAKSYIDGQEMLRLQAIAAIQFWKETNPKLKC